MDFTKKRLQQEFEDKLEVEQQNKRQLERRVSLPEAVEACAWEGSEGLGPTWWPSEGPEAGRPWEQQERIGVSASQCRGPARANCCSSVLVS